MLVDEASNLNLDDGSINMKFDVETCRSLIPTIDWRNSNYDQLETLLQAPVSDQNPKIQYLMDNHFDLHDTYKETMNGSLQQEFRKLCFSRKPFFKMKPNKLLGDRIITSIYI